MRKHINNPNQLKTQMMVEFHGRGGAGDRASHRERLEQGSYSCRGGWNDGKSMEIW